MPTALKQAIQNDTYKLIHNMIDIIAKNAKTTQSTGAINFATNLSIMPLAALTAFL